MKNKQSPTDAKIATILYKAIADADLENTPGPFEALTAELNLRDVTTTELAEVLGVSDRRISQLWQGGQIPEPRHDGHRYWFPLLESVRGYIDFLRER